LLTQKKRKRRLRMTKKWRRINRIRRMTDKDKISKYLQAAQWGRYIGWWYCA
jgi:hypothetical protein